MAPGRDRNAFDQVSSEREYLIVIVIVCACVICRCPAA